MYSKHKQHCWKNQIIVCGGEVVALWERRGGMGRRRGKDGVHSGFSGRGSRNSCLVVGADVMKGRGVPSVLCFVKQFWIALIRILLCKGWQGKTLYSEFKKEMLRGVDALKGEDLFHVILPCIHGDIYRIHNTNPRHSREATFHLHPITALEHFKVSKSKIQYRLGELRTQEMCLFNREDFREEGEEESGI